MSKANPQPGDVRYLTFITERALSQTCPVSWCRADPGEPCFAFEEGDTASPLHTPRRALVP